VQATGDFSTVAAMKEDLGTVAAMKEVAVGVISFMRVSVMQKQVLEEIKLGERTGAPAPALWDEMGGKEGRGNTVMASRNLRNSSTYNFVDELRSFAIWAERLKGKAGDWHFVMPNLSIMGSKGGVGSSSFDMASQCLGMVARCVIAVRSQTQEMKTMSMDVCLDHAGISKVNYQPLGRSWPLRGYI
jgi:hypothetical protein